MNRTYIIDGPITASMIGGLIDKGGKSLSAGGHSIFLGQVREDEIEGKKVKAIEYTAYDNMVEAEAENIISVTRKAFTDVQDIQILHSTGVVKAGENSLFIMVTAGHRDQAIRACRHVVEMIKIKFPVWKKEIFDDDSHHWRENKQG